MHTRHTPNFAFDGCRVSRRRRRVDRRPSCRFCFDADPDVRFATDRRSIKVDVILVHVVRRASRAICSDRDDLHLCILQAPVVLLDFAVIDELRPFDATAARAPSIGSCSCARGLGTLCKAAKSASDHLLSRTLVLLAQMRRRGRRRWLDFRVGDPRSLWSLRERRSRRATLLVQMPTCATVLERQEQEAGGDANARAALRSGLVSYSR